MKNLIYLILIILAFATGFSLQRNPDPEIIETSDTIFSTRLKIDTVFKYYPMPFLCYLRGDSVEVAKGVKLPVESKVYEDSTYTLQVGGIAPELDYIAVYPRTVYQDKIINNYVDRVIKVPDNKRWGIGVSAGYGFSRDGPTPFIGISINYNIFRF